MRSGTLKPRRSISLATWAISSRDGVMRPESPIMSAFSLSRYRDPLGGYHHAEVDHLEVVALQDHADDVLADVVHVALDRRRDDLALGFGVESPRRRFSSSM
jgi:hypothetical protein